VKIQYKGIAFSETAHNRIKNRLFRKKIAGGLEIPTATKKRQKIS